MPTYDNYRGVVVNYPPLKEEISWPKINVVEISFWGKLADEISQKNRACGALKNTIFGVFAPQNSIFFACGGPKIPAKNNKIGGN